MLNSLKMHNVGPSDDLAIHFSSRINLITGDNGLGKSFILDVAWWALTRQWPQTLNPALVTGYIATPKSPGEARIDFNFDSKSKPNHEYSSTYSARNQSWANPPGRPPNPGLVIYAMADGGYALWDPARNYWKNKDDDGPQRPPAYVFGTREVWDGLRGPAGEQLCNGLIADWVGWQREGGEAFDRLSKALAALSDDGSEPLVPGEPTRVSIDDVRDIPTIKTAYGDPVPVIHASSGMRRIIALAYLLVWSWQEHRVAARMLGEDPTRQATFLIDEIEAHLHPRWQRSALNALISSTAQLADSAHTQLIIATHSPLIMASAEPIFDPAKDSWFDLDLVREGAADRARVEVKKRTFQRLGDVSQWLVSEAFDLSSARSKEAEVLINRAGVLIEDENATAQQAERLEEELERVLSDIDPFWPRWRMAGAGRNWWADPTAFDSPSPSPRN